MLVAPNDETDVLLERAGAGDVRAREQLLNRYRDRLRQVVACRLDRRLAARADPSDVVQEALADAARKLGAFLRDRPLPFYPWLRSLALERLIALHRHHIGTQRRSVTRETAGVLPLNDESTATLAERLMAVGTSPVGEVLRGELRARVQSTLTRLPARDREILVLRHMDQLSVKEMAAVLRIREGAVKTRHLRALQRFRDLLVREGECP